jgi:hypothetical protein
LHINSTFAMGEECRIVRTLVPYITHIVQYSFPKCYMGLCFPRRTVMDPKKKGDLHVGRRGESVAANRADGEGTTRRSERVNQ